MSTTQFRYGLVTGSRGQPAAEKLAVEFMFSDGSWGITREIVTRGGSISRKFPSEKDQYPTIEKWPDPDEAIRAGMMRPLSPDAFERYWNNAVCAQIGPAAARSALDQTELSSPAGRDVPMLRARR